MFVKNKSLIMIRKYLIDVQMYFRNLFLQNYIFNILKKSMKKSFIFYFFEILLNIIPKYYK